MTNPPAPRSRRRPRMGEPLLASECFEIVPSVSTRSGQQRRFEALKEPPRLRKPNPLDSSNPLVCQQKQNRKAKVSRLKKAILQERETLQSPPVPSVSKIIELMDNEQSEPLDTALKALLKRLKELHDRAYRRGLTQIGKGKRLVCGLHETKKYVNLDKARLVIVAQDLEDSLFDTIQSLLASCKEKGIPYVFALNRVILGRTVFKGRAVAAVAILNYHDAQDLHQVVSSEIAASKKAHEATKGTCEERAVSLTESELTAKMGSLVIESANDL